MSSVAPVRAGGLAHADQVALAVGDDQLRPTLPSDTPEALAGLALACFDPAPEQRPSFALICHHLTQARSLL
jgi:hypothetical protein